MKPNDFTDVSIDLETLGVHATAPIIAIGLSFFNKNGEAPKEENAVHIKIDPRNYIGRYSADQFQLDYNTLVWWMKQDNALIEEYFEPRNLSVAEGLLQTHAALKDFKGRVWGNGSGFDCSVLSNAFDMFGMVTPWKFRMERDLRTIVDDANTLSGAMLARIHEGTAHNAMDDAISQAGMVQMAHRSMMQEAHGTKMTPEEAVELLSNDRIEVVKAVEPLSLWGKIKTKFMEGI